MLLVGFVIALVAGLSLRAGSADLEPAALASVTSPTPEASRPSAARPVAPADPPLTGTIVPPIRPPDASAAAPTASPTPSPAPIAAAPDAPPPAPAPAPPVPAAPAPTAAPVADPNPVLLTESRVTGRLGSTLAQEGYSVTMRPKATPSTSQCAEAHPAFAVYELTVVYSTPFSMPHVDAGMSCMDGPAFPLLSGAIYEVFVDRPAGSPIEVWISPNDGPHTLIFDFD